MRSVTNLHWPTEPFGATQRPFAAGRPMMAAIAIGPTTIRRVPDWACAVYLYTDSTCTLMLDGHVLAFGFEVLTSEPGDRPAALAERLDEILLACGRHAKCVAGHDLAGGLAALTAIDAGHRLPGVAGLRQQWTARHNPLRGMAPTLDTAYDTGQHADLAGLCQRVAITVSTVDVLAGAPPATTVRQAILRALAIALVAAHATGRYGWTGSVDLDELVTSAAWDYLDRLAGSACAPSSLGRIG